MKSFFLLAAFIIATESGNAQTVAPDVISTSGTSFSNGAGQLDWTLGEPVISNFSVGSNVLTQGFHQPNLVITSVNDPQLNFSLNIFPNPAIDILHLKFDELKEQVIVELYSSEGKLIQLQKVNSSEMEIDMSKLSPGTYLLSVKSSIFGIDNKTYKIIKSH